MTEVDSSGDQGSSGSLAELRGWSKDLMVLNEPEYRPIVTVMVIFAVIFGGMFYYAIKHDRTADLTFRTVAYVVVGILSVAALAMIARTFFPRRNVRQQPVTEFDKKLLIYCKLAEEGLGPVGTKQHYISEPFRLDPQDVLSGFERLNSGSK